MKPLNALLQHHHEPFTKNHEHIYPFTASLKVQPDATPCFHKARSVPFAIEVTISQELEQRGIISPVTHSQWAAPIVPVPRWMGNRGFAGITKRPSTRYLWWRNTPYPHLTSFSQLVGFVPGLPPVASGGSIQAYLAVNTHKGLYAYNWLPFGVASAPAIFQKMMDSILQGISGVTCCIDVSSAAISGYWKKFSTASKSMGSDSSWRNANSYLPALSIWGIL